MLAVFSTLNVAAQVFGTPRPYTPLQQATSKISRAVHLR
jgi:hypothetical protein